MWFISLSCWHDDVDSGIKTTKLDGVSRTCYEDTMLGRTGGVWRVVVLGGLDVSSGGTGRNLDQCHGWIAAVNMPRPSVLFVPRYFHCWEKGSMSKTSTPSQSACPGRPNYLGRLVFTSMVFDPCVKWSLMAVGSGVWQSFIIIWAGGHAVGRCGEDSPSGDPC